MFLLTVFAGDETPAVGRDGEVVIFLRDFENGEKFSTDVGYLAGIKEEANGNHYGASSLVDVNFLVNQPSASAPGKRTYVSLAGRIKFTDKIPYISGKPTTSPGELRSLENQAHSR